MKDKQWKDYWDLDLGSSYIPIEKLDPQVNMMELEEGGMFDEETLPDWMRSVPGVANRGFIPPQGPHPHPVGPTSGPPGLLGHPPGLLPLPGAPLLGAPGGPNLLLRPGFSHTGASMVSGPPPGFPGFDSSQPPPGVRMPGQGTLPGVLGTAVPSGVLGGGLEPMDLKEQDGRDSGDRLK